MHPQLADLAVDVVLGLHSPHRQAVTEMVACRPHTNLHDLLPTLPGLMLRADIDGGGATTWERACLGLPSLWWDCYQSAQLLSSLDQAGHLQFGRGGLRDCRPDLFCATRSKTQLEPEKQLQH